MDEEVAVGFADADDAGALPLARAVTSSLHFWRKDSSSASVLVERSLGSMVTNLAKIGSTCRLDAVCPRSQVSMAIGRAGYNAEASSRLLVRIHDTTECDSGQCSVHSD